MAYIGATPTVGNFQVCDAISVVNGQAAYTLQVGGVNVTPESANHMLVSLNGILQKPGSSFTVSGSTMTFASNLATGDVIDFVQILGNVLDLGVPSDDTVTAAKIVDDAISDEHLDVTAITGQTAETSAADGDTILIHDASASALRKMTRSNFVSGVGGANTPAFFAQSTNTEDGTDITDNSLTKLTFSTEVFDSDNTYDNSTNYRFTPGVAGKYMITAKASAINMTNNSTAAMAIYKNGSIMEAANGAALGVYTSYFNDLGNNNAGYYTMTLNAIVDSDDDDYFEIYGKKNDGGNSGGLVDKYFGAFRIIL